MVAGDIVNTASRLQSVAEPGTVVVGDVTRRATEQTIVYEAAGEHELKGKAERVTAWRALRVVSGLSGQLKSAGLEAPFVGRERELKLCKELFHGCAQERRAHLVSVTGIAGIGKSRLAWEFYKYFDGIVEQIYWHRGRCLAYGEGVAYWALADMVRMRCRIGEDEQPDAARQKLAETLEEHFPDADERSFVEPRLAQLLGLDGASTGDRQDLFAAWRLFFERLSETFPTVLAFEDMQWADTSLLDFVESLLEWSRSYPLYVITLARPEVHERRPGWGAGQRNFTSLYLEPLSPTAMEELLEGLVPGLPEGLARPDPRARAGRAAVRGRDGADAPRPRPARSGRPRVQADRRDRDARGAGDAARADRSPAGRRLARGAAAAPGRRRARQDLHRAGARGRLRARRRPSSSRCSRRSCARRCSASSPILARPSAASTASCRTSSAMSPTRRSPSGSARLRHLAAADHLQSGVRRRGRDGRGAGLALPRRLRGGAGRRRRAGDPRGRARDARQRGRARRLARRAGGGHALLRPGGRARRRSAAAGAACSSAPAGSPSRANRSAEARERLERAIDLYDSLRSRERLPRVRPP